MTERSDAEYYASLEHRAQRGKLLGNTVDEATSAAMVERVFAQPAPGVYVEVGPARNPYIRAATRPFGPDMRYVAFEGGTSRHKPGPFAAEIVGWVDPRGVSFVEDCAAVARAIQGCVHVPNREVRFVDARSMDLPTASAGQAESQRVREIYANSVIVAPGMHRESILAMLQDFFRVLDEGGRVILRDELAPGDLRGPHFLELFDMLDQAGFKKRTLITAETNHSLMRRLALLFDGPTGGRLSPTQGSYIICEKGEPGTVTAESARSFGRRIFGFRGN
jgi:hypothetical protein